MVKAELVKRSPLRIMERSTHGGVSAGHLGIIASARGVGKTACLVHIATDQLFQGKHVIHISFSGKTDHIINWYEAIFKEIAKKRSLESAVEIHDDLIKNRVIMNFHQDGVDIHQVKRSLKALIGDGQFRADTIVIDGYNFTRGNPGFVDELRKFAIDNKLSIWMTADVELLRNHGTASGRAIPVVLNPYLNSVSVLITLHSHDTHISLDLIKDHDRVVSEDMHLKLDPKTMLISESGEAE